MKTPSPRFSSSTLLLGALILISPDMPPWSASICALVLLIAGLIQLVRGE